MGSADARSAQIGGPNGKSQVFQVSAYSGEPYAAILARNLFAKDDCRATLADEAVKFRPEMAGVLMPPPLPRLTEWLAGATAGPDWSIFWPSCEPESVRPSADPCEEMTLLISNKVGRKDICD
jgi:hypothetical protein